MGVIDVNLIGGGHFLAVLVEVGHLLVLGEVLDGIAVIIHFENSVELYVLSRNSEGGAGGGGDVLHCLGARESESQQGGTKE